MPFEEGIARTLADIRKQASPLNTVLPAAEQGLTLDSSGRVPNAQVLAPDPEAGESLLTDASGVLSWGTPAADACRVYHNAAQTLTTAVAAALAFNTELLDTDAFHDTATNNSRITIPTGLDGKYIIIGQVFFDGVNTTGVREVRILKNGADIIALERNDGSSNGNAITATTFYSLAAADYVQIVALQTSGGNLNVNSSNYYSPHFSVARIGS